MDFGAVWPPSGPPLDCLLAPFGCFWPPLGLTLAPLGSHFGPSGRHPEPFQRHGLLWEVFSLTWATFGSHFSLIWLILGSLGTLFGPTWPSFWASNFRINRLVLARLSPDECWRVPAESKRILRNRLVAIGVHRHLMFSKVLNSRLPQQAEFKKQGGRRCVARRASSIN